MKLLKGLGTLTVIAWSVTAALSTPRGVPEMGLWALAATSALVAAVGMLRVNRWWLAAAGLLAVATLSVSAPGPWRSLVLGGLAVVAFEVGWSLLRFQAYAQRLSGGLGPAVGAHVRSMVLPLLVFAGLLLAVGGAAPFVAAGAPGAIPASLELKGGAGLVIPGLLVLLVPLTAASLRRRY